MTDRLASCTIVAKNYVSFARTLCRSFQAHNPGIPCYVLVIDEWKPFIQAAEEPFEAISLSELQIPNVIDMAFRYDITEFSTAVKPYLIEHLFAAKKVDRLLYLDPDILVTHSLAELFDAAGKHDFLLTPHLDADYPDDGFRPADGNILLSGVFNLGFFGIRRSNTSDTFLRWWQRKLKTNCVNQPAAGYFVDQRFIDLAVLLFPGFHIERNTGYNVAYWNLHSRRLSLESGTWKCNGGPLYFFHFSAYKIEQPNIISPHLTRYTLPDRPDLQPLFEDYRRRLLDHGYLASYQWPYTFNYFAAGEPISYELREEYRAAIERGIEIPDPFHSRKRLRAFMSASRKTQPPSSAAFSAKGLARCLTPPVVWQALKGIHDHLHW